MIPCKSSRGCYYPEEECNSVVNCPDASDEASCTCRRLIISDRICDDVPDCPDFSDELGCFGCLEGQLWCVKDLKPVCVTPEQRCDGHPHCDGNEDENFCRRLSLKQVDSSNSMIIRQRGFLQVKRGGQWMALCGHLKERDILMNEIHNLCDEIVGEKRVGTDALKFMAFGLDVSQGEKKWAHIDPHTQEMIVSDSCQSGLGVYVTCGDPTCVNNMSFERFRRDLGRVRREHSYGKKIVNGTEAKGDVWPFMVAVMRNGLVDCGASLISSDWILSAAHCFTRHWSDLFEIQVGMVRRGSWSPFEQTAIVAHVFTHESYYNKHLYNDIALGKLLKPIQLNRWVRPVCLSNDLQLPSGGALCTVAGWGAISEGGDASEYLRQVTVPAMDACPPVAQVQEDQAFCAGYPWGELDSCNGDSGGPLMCLEYGKWVQSGVVSFGVSGCARAEAPGVYTRVSYYLPWIQEKLDTMKDVANLPTHSQPTNCKGLFCYLKIGSCIPRTRMCDGMVECYDTEDEISCPEYNQHFGETGIDCTKNPHLCTDSTTDETEYVYTDDANYVTDDANYVTDDAYYVTDDAYYITDDDNYVTDTIANYVAVIEDDDNYLTVETALTPDNLKTSTDSSNFVTSQEFVSRSNISKEPHVNSSQLSEEEEQVSGTPTPAVGPGYSRSYKGSPNCSNSGIPIKLPGQEVHCSKEEFTCLDMPQCLPWDVVCDGIRHCRDGTDEIGCSCYDRLINFREDLDCDGYYDCFDLSDERCDLCRGHFLCPRSRSCIPYDLVCDTKPDCRYGEDELTCIGLQREPGVLDYDKFGQLESRSEGTLILKSGATWNSLCIDKVPDEIGPRVCSYLGYSKLASLTYTEATNNEQEAPRSFSAVRVKNVHRNVTNFRDLGQTKAPHRRSLSDQNSSRNSWPMQLKKYLDDNSSDNPGELEFLRDLGKLSERPRRRVCRQVKLSCEQEACGKVPLYYLDKNTPVWMQGGVPWAGSVYVDGVYTCGSTLVHPYWVLTSSTCMKGVNLSSSSVSVVMGSWREVGWPTRLWTGHEHDRRVIYLQQVTNTYIMVLRLEDRMPKTPYINHLCLPTEGMTNLKSGSRCSVAGRYRDRLTYGVAFSNAQDCPDHHFCPLDYEDDNLPCMRSWAGVIACQFTEGINPTWVGVGMWAYEEPVDNCTVAHHARHPLFTEDIIYGIRKLVESYTPGETAKCVGVRCVTGLCVGQEGMCDAELSCPDLTDEPPNCPNPLTMCQPSEEEGLCVCPKGGVPCGDGACIPAHKICDGEPDAADETNCVCCRHLIGSDPVKVCDGHVDCADQSDEASCGCEPAKDWFRCYRSHPPSCVSVDVMCDSKEDCSEGEDEQHCLALSPAILVTEDVLKIPERRPVGYLMVRLNGTWFTYLYEMWQTRFSHLVCLQLQYYKASVTEARNLDLRMVSQASRSLLSGNVYKELLFSRSRPSDPANNHTVVFIECMEEDPKNGNTK
ncbi:serine protease nudel-like isoform X2 [Homarus americanus]|nr:serine protease nudel-like isoform X2 [Homarus americanus]